MIKDEGEIIIVMPHEAVHSNNTTESSIQREEGDAPCSAIEMAPIPSWATPHGSIGLTVGEEWKENVFERLRQIQDSLDAAKREKNSTLTKFYEEQVEHLKIDEELFAAQRVYQKSGTLPNADDDGGSSGEGGSASHRRTVNIGVNCSFLLNIFLLFIKLYAAIRTGSTTILASLVDSILDLMSGAIMIIVTCIYDRSSTEMFPAGKHHFEPLGTLVFACAMFVSAANLLQEVADEVSRIDTVKFTMDASTVIILITVIVLKSLAFVWCNKFARGSATLLALAEDHRNDVVANIVALLGFAAATYVTVWLDPILALLVTLFILKVWGSQILSQLYVLSGHVADTSLRNAVTMLARNHDKRVLMVDTVRAFTSGTGHVVEVDFVLSEDMPLKEAHEIGESFQYFLEHTSGLNVDRAYVHLDTETDHNPHLHM
ncbi:cation transporter, putative [Bodo saltans]|uniref:Cation transporter, putative n=1 Tax=Bodo saltans TaxID=75058 RepID=A0A0S4J9Q9_BODSA|nr:cation transporter, putative [Bodo saltans]|eukprot:CUG87224.1 cation transporter, putative [Bodo saltans]